MVKHIDDRVEHTNIKKSVKKYITYSAISFVVGTGLLYYNAKKQNILGTVTGVTLILSSLYSGINVLRNVGGNANVNQRKDNNERRNYDLGGL